VIEVALRAQFGDGFRPFGAMRRRRNELEYPTGPGETTTHDEAQRAIQDAEALLQAAQQLLPTLSIFWLDREPLPEGRCWRGACGPRMAHGSFTLF